MPGKIPIEVAQRIAEAEGLKQVILVGWDGEQTHVVTFGTSASDSDQAAEGGNFVKRALGWPERLCESVSPKVRHLEERLAEIEGRIAKAKERSIVRGKGENWRSLLERNDVPEETIEQIFTEIAFL